MKILLFGKNGQVGWELHRAFSSLGEMFAFDFPEINLADFDQMREIVRSIKPHVILNASAYTDVDKAEGESNLADLINGEAPGVLAELAENSKVVLIHYSTDYVFDGLKQSPYMENDNPNPVSAYGKSKLAGEHAVQAVGCAYLIFRTSWVYSMRRKCFVTTVLRWARQQKVMRVVNDQTASPTWCRMLAQITAQIVAAEKENLYDAIQDKKGVYNLAGQGETNRYKFAKTILALDINKDEQIVESIIPAQTSEFPSPAQRPPYSALDCKKVQDVFGVYLPEWKASLELAMKTNENY